MKRWLSLFSVLLLLALGGCATKQYTPDVTADFEQSAVVTAGDFSYHCKICRTDGTVTVTVGDTAARGMVMTVQALWYATDLTVWSTKPGHRIWRTPTRLLPL